MLLKNKTAIITGAANARGIGLATARLFAEHGARVAILDLDGTAAKAAAAGLGEGHVGIACDVTDRAAALAATAEALAAFGQIDVLIANAGVSHAVKTLDIDQANWQRIIDVNLAGVLHMAQAVIPHMRGRGGSIACMSSVSGQRGGGIFGGPHYSAAKAGVQGLARAMAREFASENIRVNCVAPGLIDTDITGGTIVGEREKQILANIPLNRLGKPRDVAGIYLFLASELSAYVTGATIDVNGGMLIH